MHIDYKHQYNAPPGWHYGMADYYKRKWTDLYKPKVEQLTNAQLLEDALDCDGSMSYDGQVVLNLLLEELQHRLLDVGYLEEELWNT